MNSENNNFNSHSTNNQQSTQPVRNMFFSNNSFNNNSIADVGSSTTRSANNKVTNQVISWGVGKKAAQEQKIIKPSIPTESLFDFDEQEPVFGFGEDSTNVNEEIEVLSDDMLNEVNGVVYTSEQPEILDSNFLNTNNKNSKPSVNMNLMPQNNMNSMTSNNKNSKPSNNINLMTANNMNSVPSSNMNPMALNNMNSMIPNNINPIASNNMNSTLPNNMNPMPRNNIGPQQTQYNNVNQFNPNQEMISDNLINQQPLSMNNYVNNSPTVNPQPNNNQPTPVFFNQNVMNGNFAGAQANEQFRQQIQAQQMREKQNAVITDPDIPFLLKAYVGAKFQKFQMSPFSFGAFFFGGFYFFYRRMYLLGLLVYILEFGALILSPNLIGLGMSFALRIICALMVNYLYLKFANRTVVKIKAKYPNKNLSELVQICVKKGRPDLLGAFLLNIILNAGFGSALFNVVGNNIFGDYLDKLKQPSMEEKIEKEEFNGQLKYSNYDINNKFTFVLPNGFVKSNNTEKLEYIYTSSNAGENNTCVFSLAAIDGYDKSADLIKDLALYNNMNASIDSTISSGLEWYTFYADSNVGKKYYRSTLTDNKVFLFEYTSGINTPEGVCDSYLVNILDSIAVKGD